MPSGAEPFHQLGGALDDALHLVVLTNMRQRIERPTVIAGTVLRCIERDESLLAVFRRH
jgi:hypothetical protein